MIRSIFSGSWLVFRSGHEYMFIHGETSDFLTVKVSVTDMNMFKQYEMTEEDVAKLAAEWVSIPNEGTGLWILVPVTVFQNSVSTITRLTY